MDPSSISQHVSKHIYIGHVMDKLEMRRIFLRGPRYCSASICHKRSAHLIIFHSTKILFSSVRTQQIFIIDL